MTVGYSDLPALLRAADANSLAGQRRYLRATRIQLTALVAAAVFGALSLTTSGVDVSAVLATVAFATALVSEIYQLKERPDRHWYGGRAVAESVKTLTWRYMVGGAPLGTGVMETDRATEVLMERLAEIQADVQPIWLLPDHGAPDQVTAGMRRARELPLDGRRDLYLRQRIDDQWNWYARKARWNARRSTHWAVLLAVLELVGISAGIMRVAELITIDVLGIAAALAAAGAAWVQTKQHQNLATAYGVATHELAAIRARAERARSEDTWAAFVADAEEAISREHTLWRASHGG
ncbi:DUF4231 domain-containing protein [Streptomyces sp. G5(2025)]|uniref:DUF4231 domain-containing protein n=1 Tax=Streptomyces sp. G5(2025) TaxID=3406628 RepID=UPI003C27DD4D